MLIFRDGGSTFFYFVGAMLRCIDLNWDIQPSCYPSHFGLGLVLVVAGRTGSVELLAIQERLVRT
jgi:hypothetical protein